MTFFEKVCGLVFCLFIFFIAPISASYVENHYNIVGTVVEVDGNLCLIEDIKGDEWYYISNELQVDDTVKMYMTTNYTDNTVEDDKIEKIKIVVDKK